MARDRDGDRGSCARDHPHALRRCGDRPLRVRCTGRCCSTRTTGRCAPRSCGTTAARTRRRRSWRDAPAIPRSVTGVLPMPGFTAPKFLWVATHEPESSRACARSCCRRTSCACAYRRAPSELSDAAGTWWLDAGVAGLVGRCPGRDRPRRSHMPRLCEAARNLAAPRRDRDEWGMRGRRRRGWSGDMPPVPPASARVHRAGLPLAWHLGQSLRADPLRPLRPGRARVLPCLPGPGTRCRVLNGASCLAGRRPAGCDERRSREAEPPRSVGRPLPALSRRRADAAQRSVRPRVFFGLGPRPGRADLVRAVLEGVAFASRTPRTAFLGRARRSPAPASAAAARARVSGYGSSRRRSTSRSAWYDGADKGPAFGAARLARLAVTGERAGRRLHTSARARGRGAGPRPHRDLSHARAGLSAAVRRREGGVPGSLSQGRPRHSGRAEASLHQNSRFPSSLRLRPSGKAAVRTGVRGATGCPLKIP